IDDTIQWIRAALEKMIGHSHQPGMGHHEGRRHEGRKKRASDTRIDAQDAEDGAEQFARKGDIGEPMGEAPGGDARGHAGIAIKEMGINVKEKKKTDGEADEKFADVFSTRHAFPLHHRMNRARCYARRGVKAKGGFLIIGWQPGRVTAPGTETSPWQG